MASACFLFVLYIAIIWLCFFNECAIATNIGEPSSHFAPVEQIIQLQVANAQLSKKIQTLEGEVEDLKQKMDNFLLMDYKRRETEELKSELAQSKETNEVLTQHIMDLQYQVHLLTENNNYILATLSHGSDSHGQPNWAADEGTQLSVDSSGAGDSASFSYFSAMPTPSSQSESKPKDSYANVVIKPPPVTNTQKLTKTVQSPSAASQTNSSTSQTADGDEDEEAEKASKDQLHKTVICRYWKAHASGERWNKCQHGANCVFAHGEKELKLDTNTRNFKTELCRFWSSDEPCSNGASCHFAHGSEELRQKTVKDPKSAEKVPSPSIGQRLRKTGTRTKTQTFHPPVSSGKN